MLLDPSSASDGATRRVKTWHCPKCGRELKSGGESIPEAMSVYWRVFPDPLDATDIKCSCGAVLSAKDLMTNEMA